jgi:hypothetical protein
VGPGLGPVPGASLAGLQRLDPDLFPDAERRFLEGQSQVHLEVGPAAGSGPLPGAAGGERRSEERLEDVADVAHEPEHVGREALSPERVVPAAASGVGQRLVGQVDLLEPLLRLGVSPVDVGVEGASEPTVGLLDVFL